MNQRFPSKLIRASLFVLATLPLAGCLKGTSDLQEFVEHEKANPSRTPITPVPAPKNFETFTYHVTETDASGHQEPRRDPFGASRKEQKEAESANGTMPDPHPKEKLENYPLDALKMVGTVGAGSGIEGLIKDPDGTVNRVHIGNYLGQNNGKIVAISTNRIDLVELIPEGNGRWPQHPTSIELGGSTK